jgi:hypothetical protein
MRTETLIAPILLALLSVSCIASSTLSATQRSVASEHIERIWTPASPPDLDGLFESVEIDGEAAAALLRIYYCFNADHTYTGAALTTGAEHAEFATLFGSWELVDGELRLDADERVSASVSGELLRLESTLGTAVFKRASVQ